MVSSFNPTCYIPTVVNKYLPKAVACAPPPSYFSNAYNLVTSPVSSTYTTLYTMLDALVSLPFLSFLLIPTMGSYSTSLNLLFFYLTWSTLVLSHPPLQVELVATLAIRTLFYIFPSVFFLAFDILVPSAAAGMKALGSAGLPFQEKGRSRGNRGGAATRQIKILGWSIGNVLLAVAMQGLIEIFFTRVLLIRSVLRVSTALPTPFAILKDLGRGYLLREVLVYILHRYILHEGSLGTDSLSAVHESWYHSLHAPFPLSATYDHPAAYLIRSFIPVYLPAMIFRFHLLTYIMYLTIISLEETFAYSGYSTVPTNFILGGIARRTDNHVLSGGDGNYGCWGLIDWAMSTSIGGDIMDDVGQEAEKHDVSGKTHRAKAQIGDGVRRRINEGKKSTPTRSRRRQDS